MARCAAAQDSVVAAKGYANSRWPRQANGPVGLFSKVPVFSHRCR